MPFRSKAQERYLYAQHPELARRWQKLYGQPENLPEHVKPKRKVKRRK